MNDDPSALGALSQTKFEKNPNRKEFYSLVVMVGEEVRMQTVSALPPGPHVLSPTPYRIDGHRDDFLRLARMILAELERTPDQIHETLLRIEKLLEKNQP